MVGCPVYCVSVDARLVPTQVRTCMAAVRRQQGGRRDAGAADSMIGSASDAGQGFVYSGQIEKGQMHGKGTLVYPNGKFGIACCPPSSCRDPCRREVCGLRITLNVSFPST